ncbi:glutamate--cysteine ligase [Streptomyces fructofermentans]|uniref:glutamate--cysteine ligase 2 n=1 Tax=Streptomyces fructofermentans TaxID=152141 RepID=UPI00340BD44F
MRTVGVEEELLLVDPRTGEPQALSSAVMARAARADVAEETFEKEFHDQQLEFATHPRADMEELGAEIVRCRKVAALLAADTGATVAALATSPLPVTPTVGMGSRYRWMADEFGLPAQEQLACGCHIHVSVESDDEGAAVLDRIGPWLSVLSALSGNSPFWQGADSLYSSYRSRVWLRWPMAGPTGLFGSAAEYHRRVADMIATGVVRDEGMVYYDARISAKFPTVEIRVADVCLDAAAATLIATLARGLVETAAREWRAGTEPLGHSVDLLRLAAWRAARSGLDERLLHPVSMRPEPADDVVRALLEHVGEALDSCGDAERARTGVAELLLHGNGARVQRRLLDETGSLGAVVTECARRTQA